MQTLCTCSVDSEVSGYDISSRLSREWLLTQSSSNAGQVCLCNTFHMNAIQGASQ